MSEPLKMLKQQGRWLWDLPSRILSRFAQGKPARRRDAADRNVTDARARFWREVREGRREAADRVTRGAP